MLMRYDMTPSLLKKFQVVVEDNNINKQDKGINVCWKLKIAFLYSIRLLFQFIKIKIRNIYNDALSLDLAYFMLWTLKLNIVVERRKGKYM